MEKLQKNISLKGISCLNIERSIFCGQAFRWVKDGEGKFHGVIFGKVIEIEENKNEIIFKNISQSDYDNIVVKYFDIERDYKKICESLSKDKSFAAAYKEYEGIRILKQDSWEALCSFIISQNNNIPRISGIIDRFCRAFGEKLDGDNYSFPSYERLKNITVEDLAPLRAGFRAKYIVDAVNKLNSGEISLKEIENMPIEKARIELQKIKGVGAKVAECTLLYGFGKVEAFPVDVWVKRIMAEMYPQGLPEYFKGNEGIAQQYLFHWRRNLKESEIK